MYDETENAMSDKLDRAEGTAQYQGYLTSGPNWKKVSWDISEILLLQTFQQSWII